MAQRKRNRGVTAKRQAAGLNSPAARQDREESRRATEVKWGKIAVISSAITLIVGAFLTAILGPFVAELAPHLFESWIAPRPVSYSTEGIASNGRVVEVIVQNTGKSPAEDLVVIVESMRPSFQFDSTAHVHSLPEMSFVTEWSDSKLTLRLDHPLKRGDRVLFTIDNLPYTEDLDSLFVVGVNYQGGQTRYLGHDVRVYPDLRADQIGFETVKAYYNHVKGE